MEVTIVMQTMLVGLAGACGAGARYLLGRFVAERVASRFPWGTLLINISGAFVIGLVFALTAQRVLSPLLQTILATGFLGGYTTFSTMSWEGVQLARGGRRVSCALYLVGSLTLGLVAVGGGIALGGLIG